MPTLVESNGATANLVAAAVAAPLQVVANLDVLKQHLAAVNDEYAILLGPDIDLQAAAALADTLRVTRPATSVILIRHRVDTVVLAEALRSGMREVVEERDLTGLAEAVRRAAEVWTAFHGAAPGSDEPAGKVITVFSPKGGVGKTTLAVNVAIALAEDTTKRVCLVDLDLAFGDVAITLQLFPSHTIADAAGMTETLDAALLQTLLISYRDNITALIAPVQPDAKEAIPAALIGRTLRLLKHDFDYVVVDTAPAFDEYALQAFDETDQVLLVTTLDVPTLKNVKIAIETLDLLNFPAGKRSLVLNRADEKVGLTASKVESALGMDIAATIPTSAQVANSTNTGEPIVGLLPRHPVSHAIRSLSQLAADIAPEPTATGVPSQAGARRRSLLRRK